MFVSMFRHVTLPADVARLLPKDRLLTEVSRRSSCDRALLLFRHTLLEVATSFFSFNSFELN